MPADNSSEVKFEIGHVLFIDIVGYSKLLIKEQSEQLQKLREILRAYLRETVQNRPARSRLYLHRPRRQGASFRWARKDYEMRLVGLISLKVHPWYDSLRADPRFADLLRRTNLTP